MRGKRAKLNDYKTLIITIITVVIIAIIAGIVVSINTEQISGETKISAATTTENSIANNTAKENKNLATNNIMGNIILVNQEIEKNETNITEETNTLTEQNETTSTSSLAEENENKSINTLEEQNESTQTNISKEQSVKTETNTSAENNESTETNTSTEQNKSTQTNAAPEKEEVEEKKEEKTAATAGEKGVIYLTFDDGPSTNVTPKILDILKEEDVKATFFILNYNSEGEKIVKRENEEGHSIGIHGYSHSYSEIYKNEETYMNNLDKLQEKIKNSIGITSKITRFPGGSSNTVSKKYNETNGLMSRLVKLVEEKGYKYYDWNVDSDDAGSAASNKTKIYNNVTKGLSKNRPNVVLMHDTNAKKATLNALRDIIKYGKENGYEFKAITYDGDLVNHHNVNN